MEDKDWRARDVSLRNDESVRKLFEIYRDYTKHEDSLVKERTTTGLSIQAVLFAGVGFAIIKIDPSSSYGSCAINKTYGVFEFFKYWWHLSAIGLAFIGMVAARMTLASVGAAELALGKLRDRWDALQAALAQSSKVAQMLPSLTHGYNEHFEGGIQTAKTIPRLALIVWVVIFCLILFGLAAPCFTDPRPPSIPVGPELGNPP
jgi:hypothetical protein